MLFVAFNSYKTIQFKHKHYSEVGFMVDSALRYPQSRIYGGFDSEIFSESDLRWAQFSAQIRPWKKNSQVLRWGGVKLELGAPFPWSVNLTLRYPQSRIHGEFDSENCQNPILGQIRLWMSSHAQSRIWGQIRLWDFQIVCWPSSTLDSVRHVEKTVLRV